MIYLYRAVIAPVYDRRQSAEPGELLVSRVSCCPLLCRSAAPMTIKRVMKFRDPVDKTMPRLDDVMMSTSIASLAS